MVTLQAAQAAQSAYPPAASSGGISDFYLISINTIIMKTLMQHFLEEEAMVRVLEGLLAGYCVLSLWGCGLHGQSSVQPNAGQQSAIGFAQQMIKDMSSGWNKFISPMKTQIRDEGDYRVLRGEVYAPTAQNIMSDFTRFCQSIQGEMLGKVCRGEAENDVRFKIDYIIPSIKVSYASLWQQILVELEVYEPVGQPSERFLQMIRAEQAPTQQRPTKTQQAVVQPPVQQPQVQTQQETIQPLAQQLPALTSALIGRRIALVIGNGRYQYSAMLKNPIEDSQLLATTLQKINFGSVLIKNNLTRDLMIQALREFATMAAQADWAVVYYAGHGLEVGGTNYLVPVDAQLKADRDVALETVSLGQVMNTVEAAKQLRLVILDSCRDNPFARRMQRTNPSRSTGRGLAPIEPDAGTLVIYSAKHGEVAYDGDGANSPFAEALVKRIQQKPSIEIRRLFDFVRDDVLASTQKRQQPFSYGSLSASQDFFFVK